MLFLSKIMHGTEKRIIPQDLGAWTLLQMKILHQRLHEHVKQCFWWVALSAIPVPKQR